MAGSITIVLLTKVPSEADAPTIYKQDYYQNLPQKLEWKLILYNDVLKAGLSYADFVLLKRITMAESNFEQFDKNGRVLRGKKNKHDIGIFQINVLYHPELPIWTAGENIDSAVSLYKKSGSKPWNWSKSVWNKEMK